MKSWRKSCVPRILITCAICFAFDKHRVDGEMSLVQPVIWYLHLSCALWQHTEKRRGEKRREENRKTEKKKEHTTKVRKKDFSILYSLFSFIFSLSSFLFSLLPLNSTSFLPFSLPFLLSFHHPNSLSKRQTNRNTSTRHIGYTICSTSSRSQQRAASSSGQRHTAPPSPLPSTTSSRTSSSKNAHQPKSTSRTTTPSSGPSSTTSTSSLSYVSSSLSCLCCLKLNPYHVANSFSFFHVVCNKRFKNQHEIGRVPKVAGTDIYRYSSSGCQHSVQWSLWRQDIAEIRRDSSVEGLGRSVRGALADYRGSGCFGNLQGQLNILGCLLSCAYPTKRSSAKLSLWKMVFTNTQHCTYLGLPPHATNDSPRKQSSPANLNRPSDTQTH